MTGVVMSACYVFGIVENSGEAQRWLEDAGSFGTRAAFGDIRLIPYDGLAAVVGSIDPERGVGRAADLRVHDRVLATLAGAGVAVLPFRFGGVLADDDAVRDHLLAVNAGRFAAALRRVKGRVQYSLKARFEEEPAIRAALQRHPDLARLKGKVDPANLGEQIRLGEAVSVALRALRRDDAAALTAELEQICARVRVGEPKEADDVLDAAVLVDVEASEGFEQAVERWGEQYAGWLRIRLVGPVAPYDFVLEE
jgi:Gas vesicle synthesis protein GvpL/GvpF